MPDGAPKDLAKSTSLNIKAVIVLYEAISLYSRSDLPEEACWGVIPAPATLDGSDNDVGDDSDAEAAF